MFLIIIILIILTKTSVWTLPFVRDSFAYAYVGRGLSEGSVLYKQIWDHKPPGVYFLDALVYKISSNNYILDIRVISIFFAIVGSLFLYKLLRIFFSKKTSQITTLLFSFFVNVYVVTQGDNMIETYMVPVVVLLYFLFVKADKSKSNKYYFFAGMSSGILFLLKQVGILPLFPIIIYMLFNKEKIIKYLFIFLGFIAALSPVFIYLYMNNVLIESFDSIFLYNYFYSKQGYTLASLSQSMYYFLQVFTGTAMLWFLAIIGLLGLVKTKIKRIDILFLLFFLFSFIGTAMGGRFAFSRNYFLLVFPSLAYFSAYAVDQIKRYPKSYPKLILYVGAIFILFPSVVLQGQAILSGLYFSGRINPSETEAMYALGLSNYNFVKSEKTYYSVAEYVKKHAYSGDYILDWGAEPEIYLLSNTYSPTRFFYSFPVNGVFIKDNKQNERKSIFIKEVNLNKPKYLIANEYEERYKPAFNKLNFEVFEKLIINNYILEKKIDNYLIFKIRE